jgi:glucose-1-phosphatase
MSEIKTVFFDFGNVIAYFDHQRAVRRLVAHTDRPAPELTLQLYGGELETMYEMGQISTEQYIAGALKDGRLRCSPEEFRASFVDIFWPNQPVHRLVEKLKPFYRLVLASNTNDAHFEHFREEYDYVLKYFDHLGTSHRAGARKPHREFFAYCQRFAGCSPSECLFIDDLATNVEAAVRFGWRGIVYSDHADLLTKLQQLGLRGVNDEPTPNP